MDISFSKAQKGIFINCLLIESRAPTISCARKSNFFRAWMCFVRAQVKIFTNCLLFESRAPTPSCAPSEAFGPPHPPPPSADSATAEQNISIFFSTNSSKLFFATFAWNQILNISFYNIRDGVLPGRLWRWWLWEWGWRRRVRSLSTLSPCLVSQWPRWEWETKFREKKITIGTFVFYLVSLNDQFTCAQRQWASRCPPHLLPQKKIFAHTLLTTNLWGVTMSHFFINCRGGEVTIIATS